jgi:hypothetical protein
MRHRGSDEGVRVVGRVQPVDQFGHELRDFGGVWRGVGRDRCVTGVGDVNRALPPLAGWLARTVPVALKHPVQRVQ